jgi:hypothetical protein
MKESEHAAWVRHFDAIGDELLRLAHICDVPLRQPGVVERVLKNDETVCGKKNPIGFRKLRELVMATFTSTDKALERIGPDEMKLIVDALYERIDRRMELAGSAKKSRPTSDKSK